METHWLLRIGDGKHFMNSSKDNIWGVSTKNTCTGAFLREVKDGDLLWFVQSNSHGKLFALAIYKSHNIREIGPIISLTQTNEELGWTDFDGDWDYEVHYTDLHIIKDLNLLSRIQSPLVIRKYVPEKCKVNLPEECLKILNK